MAFIVFSWGCYGIQIGTFWIRSHANTCTRSGSFGDSGHGMGGWVACEADLDQTRCPLDLGWNWHKFNETLLISWYMLDQGVRRGRIVVHGDLLTILPLRSLCSWTYDREDFHYFFFVPGTQPKFPPWSVSTEGYHVKVQRSTSELYLYIESNKAVPV
jgi:hypothetical protein